MATLNDLVAKYIELRDRKNEMERRHKEKKAELTRLMNKLENVMMKAVDSAGVESARTSHGTCYITTRTSASVADRDTFLEFVRNEGAWDMLESRCAKSAVEQYLDAEGELPPGINYRTERAINVKR